jgi:hypothetical protein
MNRTRTIRNNTYNNDVKIAFPYCILLVRHLDSKIASLFKVDIVLCIVSS